MARYIDADEFCGWLETVLKDFGEPNINIRPVAFGSQNALRSVLEVVKKQPTADVVEVKHGEWIIQPKIQIPLSYAYIRKMLLYSCPYCKKEYRQKMNYCGNCGTKMDGKPEGESNLNSTETWY